MTAVPLRTWADIDLDAVVHNLAVLRRQAGPAEVVGVVKGDAYGHGAVPVALALRDAGVGVFGVAAIDEAVELREAGITAPMWHFGVPLPEDLPALLDLGIVPTVTEPEVMARLIELLRARGRQAVVHLKLDSGMGRRGTDLAATRALWESAAASGLVTVDGVCTHFSTADMDVDFACEQITRFARDLDLLARAGLRPRCIHAANSAAMLRLPQTRYDYVRPGIALYGAAGFPAPAVAELRPAMSLRSRLVQVRELPAGSDVGYAHGCRLATPTRVGLVPVGYADGWPWSLANRGQALVRGRRAAYLGRVNMDMIQLDLTTVPGAAVGDQVVLVGADAAERISVQEVAGWAGTSDYAISTQLSRRVTRRFWRDGRLAAVRGMDGVVRWEPDAVAR